MSVQFNVNFALKHRTLFIPIGLIFMATACLNTGYAAGKDQEGAELLLTKDGVSAATIVIGKEASRSAQLAAVELQYHIEKISGAKLPVVSDAEAVKGVRILVGASKATQALGLSNRDFKTQEYLIRFLPDTLILMGKDKEDPVRMDYANERTFPDQYDEQATCYAVYDFLERCCGVRWYLPTELGLVCPRQATLAVKGAEVRRAPAMKWREMYQFASVPADLCDEPGPRLPDREGRLFAHRWRMGGQPYAANHAFYHYYFRHLKDHPEWFAKGYDKDMPEELRDKRKPFVAVFTPGGGGTYSGDGYPMKYYPNLCYTDAGFISNVIRRANAYFDTGKAESGESAAGDYFSLGPMDSESQDKMCQCAECRKLIHKEPPCNKWRKQWFYFDDKNSDYIFDFVNKVAKEVGKTHPGKYLTMFAYHQTYYPPTREHLEPNVAITFCIQAQLRPVPAQDRAVTDLLNKWDEESRVRPKYLWLYFHEPGRANPFFPGFMAHHMVKQMADYHQRGFRGIFAEPAYMPRKEPGPARRCLNANLLEMYLTFKMAYDETLDGDKLIDEFFTLFYGAAARPMQKLYEAIERVYCDPANYTFDPRYFGYQTPDIAWGRLGTAERMAEFGKLMAEAKNAAQTEMEKKRVALFEKSVWNRMQAGRKDYLEFKSRQDKFPLQSGRAVRITGVSPDGDPVKVDWSKAEVLGNWRSLLKGEPTARRLEARALHDGRYLYLRLQEDTSTNTPTGAGGEQWWQLCFGRGRSAPYNDIWIDSQARHVDVTVGGASREWDSGAVVRSNVNSSSNRWEVLLALPFAKLLPGEAQPGNTLYMNIIRYYPEKAPALAWNPTLTTDGYEPLRFGELTLDR